MTDPKDYIPEEFENGEIEARIFEDWVSDNEEQELLNPYE